MIRNKKLVVPVFSVVVPVYNAERYLNKALQSILDQDFTDFELILVNDGSTDGSRAVLEVFAETDDRVIVLSNDENCGAAEARNRGIEIAKGKFLYFVDADDFIESGLLQRFYDAFQTDDCDFVKCSAYEEYYDANDIILYTKSCVLPDQSFQDVKAIANQVIDMEQIPLFGYNWNSCYKMQAIKDHQLRFDNTLKVHEDFAFNMAYLPFVRHMRCLSYCGYHDTKRTNNSLSLQKSNYVYNIQLLKIHSFLSLLKKNRNETQENMDKIYWMFTRFTYSVLESGTSMEAVRKEPIFDAYKKHCFESLGFKKKVLTVILQSNNVLLIRVTAGLMGLVKRYLPVFFAKIKK